jgi:glyoxylase-like metal-dependent hydrolase (beta-lactamase superfamily II)
MPHKIKVFKKELAKTGIKEGDIKLIVLTHSHFDHCGSAFEIRKLTGAKVAIHESERKYLEYGGMLIPKGVNFRGKITQPILFPFFKRISFTKFSPDILIKDDPYPLTEYGIRGNIVHTPGHTIGSLSIILDTGEGFVGCMAHNGFPFRSSPGLPIYAEDIEEIKKQWRILTDSGVKTIYPGHGKPFPIEVLRKSLEGE